MTEETVIENSYEIKSCVGCGAKDLPPTFAVDKAKAVYKCVCGCKYKAHFIDGEPFKISALVILSGKEYYINGLSTDIFHGRILLNTEDLQDLAE